MRLMSFVALAMSFAFGLIVVLAPEPTRTMACILPSVF